MSLAIFDLDNTLLSGDSDYSWGMFLVSQGIVDREAYERENQRFYEEYKAGTLDIHEFQAFSLQPLTTQDPQTLQQWHNYWLEKKQTSCPVNINQIEQAMYAGKDANIEQLSTGIQAICMQRWSLLKLFLIVQ